MFDPVFTPNPDRLIDDPIFLEIAKCVLRDPTKPYSGWVNWNGWEDLLFNFVSSSAGIGYYLAAVALFVYGHDRSDRLLLTLSGISAALALMVRYNAVSVVAVMALYYGLFFRREARWNILAAAVPVASFLAWSCYTHHAYGAAHFLKQLEYQAYLQSTNLEGVVRHVTPHLCHLGGGTLFAALFYFPLLRRRLHIVSLLLGLLLAAAGCLFLREAAGYNRVNSLLTAAFLLNISFFLVSQILEALPRLRERRLAKESLFLLAWLGVVVATQFSGIHAAAKYMI